MPRHDANGGAFPAGCDRALAAALASSFRHAARYFMAPGMGEHGVLVELRSDLGTHPERADDPVDPEELAWTT